ncbi:MAG: hypothetical protein HYV52_02925 [Parcubacteria group bacterium]|nr:hypothetical protein [Parcubacteria group bacterium]
MEFKEQINRQEKIEKRTPEEELADFKHEIAKLQEAEKEKVLPSRHFMFGQEEKREYDPAMPEISKQEKFNPDDLTLEDLEIRKKFGYNFDSAAITQEEFEKYRDSVLKSKNQSRMDFVGFLGNQFAAIKVREYSKKKHKEKTAE